MKKENEISPERAKTLLDDKDISEDHLKRILARIKAFCRLAYHLYSKEANDLRDGQEIDFSDKPPGN